MDCAAVRRFLQRLAASLRSNRADAELSREMHAHLRLIEEDFVSRGMSADEARCAARRAFGGLEQMKEHQRDARSFRFLTGWQMDLTLALRMLFRYPTLSAIAVFGIAVATAMAATMFTLIGEQLSPAPPPLPQGERIVALQNWSIDKNQSDQQVLHDLATWREQLTTVRDIGAFQTVTKNLVVPPAAPEPVQIAEMSAAGFDTAGVAPLMGRRLRADDERAGAPPVIVIGYNEWRTRFASNPNVLQTTVQLGGQHHAVVGVMPEGFAFPIQHSFWTPLRLNPSDYPVGDGPFLSVFGRLADGVTLGRADAELRTIGERARVAWPETHEHLRPRVVRYTEQFSAMESPANRVAGQIIRYSVALLLVVVCINVAVLVYARTAARQTEVTLRTALGASRMRIIIQLFGEGLVLAGLGSVAGLSIAAIALARIREGIAQFEALPFWVRLTLSGPTIVYMVVLTVVAAALIGALPAWKATGSLLRTRLQELTGGGRMQLGRVWTALILLQVAFAVAILPMVVVRMSELARAGLAPLGFPANEFLVAQLAIDPPAEPRTAPPPTDALTARVRDLERSLMRAGAVRAVAYASVAPGFERTVPIQREPGGMSTVAAVNRVSVNLFETFRVPILSGRAFSTVDATPEARTVIVSRAFANVLSEGGAGVLGARVRLAEGAFGVNGFGEGWHEIIGIVEDFPRDESANPQPRLYTARVPEPTEPLTLALHLHEGDTEAWGTRLRQLAADVDPALQVRNVLRMEALLEDRRHNSRLLAAVLVGMTLSVLLVSAAGIYAMMSFAVMQRRREISIRLALGAQAGRILWTVFSRAAMQLVTGAALGLIVALLLNHAADGVLLKTHAVLATGGVVLLTIAVGLIAALGPARQGLRIQPTETMREL